MHFLLAMERCDAAVWCYQGFDCFALAEATLRSSDSVSFAFGSPLPAARPDKHVFTLTIGRRQTNARYYVDSVKDMYSLLRTLAVSDSKRRRAGSMSGRRGRASSQAHTASSSGFVAVSTGPGLQPLTHNDSVGMLSTARSLNSLMSDVSESGSNAIASESGDGTPLALQPVGEFSSAFFSGLIQPPVFNFPANLMYSSLQ